MLEHEYLGEFKIGVIKATEPFNLNELYTLMRGVKNGEQPHFFAGLALLDLRQVNLDAISIPEIRRHLMKKSTLGAEYTNCPCAYLVKDISAHSKTRMALVYSELAGVADEENAIICNTLKEAVDWLANLSGCNPADLSAVLESDAMRLVKAGPNE